MADHPGTLGAASKPGALMNVHRFITGSPE